MNLLWRLYLHISLNVFFIWNKKFIEFLQTFFYCFLKILLDLVFYTFGFRYQDKRLWQLFLSHLIDLYMYTTIRYWCWSSGILQAKETKAHFYTGVSRVTGNCFYPHEYWYTDCMTNKDKMVEAGACVPMQPKTSKDLFGPINFFSFVKEIQYTRNNSTLYFIMINFLLDFCVAIIKIKGCLTLK